eukprot:SAG31_NODE_10654_length_1113_cov_1.748521_1_plen_202_part_00
MSIILVPVIAERTFTNQFWGYAPRCHQVATVLHALVWPAVQVARPPCSTVTSEAGEVIRFLYAISEALDWGSKEAEGAITHLVRAIYAGITRCPKSSAITSTPKGQTNACGARNLCNVHATTTVSRKARIKVASIAYGIQECVVPKAGRLGKLPRDTQCGLLSAVVQCTKDHHGESDQITLLLWHAMATATAQAEARSAAD